MSFCIATLLCWSTVLVTLADPSAVEGRAAVGAGAPVTDEDDPKRKSTVYFTFSQTSVVTAILPSRPKGAGLVVYTSLSPSFFTSLICVVPVQILFHDMSMWCSMMEPSNL